VPVENVAASADLVEDRIERPDHDACRVEPEDVTEPIRLCLGKAVRLESEGGLVVAGTTCRELAGSPEETLAGETDCNETALESCQACCVGALRGQADHGLPWRTIVHDPRRLRLRVPVPGAGPLSSPVRG
jgi:hypothetical protein